jgi:DNA-binding transcriptional LysR family regulator
MQRLNLRLLEVFRTVFDAKSMTEAAATLNVTQPAVSKGISQLESELDVRLFSRVHGRLYPTADGQRIYSECSRLFAQLKVFQENLTDLNRGLQGKVSVAAVPTLAAPLVASAAARFSANRPRVKVDVVIAQADSVVAETTHHSVDFGLMHSPVKDRNICSEPIGETEIVAILRAEHPLALKKVLSPRDLAGVPLIMLDTGSPPSHLVRETFEEALAPMNIVMEANSSGVAAAAAGAGMGIALIDPWPTLISPSAATVIRRFAPRVPLRVVVIHSVFRPPSVLAAAMCEEIRHLLAEFAAAGPLVKTAAGRQGTQSSDESRPASPNAG